MARFVRHFDLVNTRHSATLKQANTYVIRSYRNIYRFMPFLLSCYGLQNVTTRRAMKKVAEKFRANAHLRDPRLIDVARFRGEIMLEEYVKRLPHGEHLAELIYDDVRLTPEHLMPPSAPGSSSFLNDFFRDNIMLPTAKSMQIEKSQQKSHAPRISVNREQQPQAKRLS
eukprot:TRINITY_DN11849_c0_g1_i1.p1 TRINITY_DN11849_c0_g1~~TRINITY_DN11849_c0_g1_i1.p1  ORF type:complete len:170 (+),score=29.96 TRINITY_DN11849_c0_g1_i1:46-555(+)